MRPEDAERLPRTTGDAAESRFLARAPAIQLPKGGGAIRGIGEKFSANPVTGTGSMAVPIPTSPGRAGFGPQLSLQYDSAAGNSPFGFGWTLSLPAIARKTDKGLPRYLDAIDSDVFILAGAEDLVPTLVKDADGNWVEESVPSRTIAGKTYAIRRYRPRAEGLFARIERWTNSDDPADVHWRSISRDNVLTLYGADEESRIFDPADPRLIFSWLICETRDDKGNGLLYRYKAEDGEGVDPGRAHEQNRGARDAGQRTANRYVKRIHYGNRASLLDDAGRRPPFVDKDAIRAQIENGDWMFEVVFDYGEHGIVPLPNDSGAWRFRPDPFSTYRAGFEVRTTRLCRRVLMFHHFDGRAGVERNCLVRSTELVHSTDLDPADMHNPVYALLRAIAPIGYRRKPGGYDERRLPPVEFTYTKPIIQDTVEEVRPEYLENLPIGVDGNTYRWTDLHGEGIPGVLTEQGGTWYYRRNCSPIPDRLPDGREMVTAKFSPLEAVALKPNLGLAAGADITDLAGDGQPDLVAFDETTPGLYEHDDQEGWQPFRPFSSWVGRNFRDPNLKLVDLDGDGHADVLITEHDAFVWHASLAEEGFGPAQRVALALDEEKGPRVVFADATQSIYLADLSGDGLTDIVRIRNGEICYWPNLGYGRFGAKIAMDNAPWFDHPDQFAQRRIRLADIDGSGTTDIIYLHRDGVRVYFNQSGNSWSETNALKVFPRVDDVVSIMPSDLLGNGTACLVWSSPLAADGRRPMRYVNLMGEHKPHLLIKVKNNIGGTTEVGYAPSTKFYLQDRRDGKPWATKVPFPVHVVERVTVKDRWRNTTFTTRYSYHHGYFDGVEREFRGFGRVEVVDAEDYGTFAAGNVDSPYITPDQKLHQPPVKTVTWFHTGAFEERARVSSLYEDEYFPNGSDAFEPGANDFRENRLPEPDFAALDLTTDELREALRACKGAPLRQEIYELDVDALRDGRHRPVKLFSTAYHHCHIDRLQPRGPNRHAVFLTTESEAVTYHYELDISAPGAKPDPRVSHTLNLRIDAFGNVLQSVAVGYPRFVPFTDPAGTLATETTNLIRRVQGELHLAYTETRFTDADIDTPDVYRLRMPCQVQTYELTGIGPQDQDDRTTDDRRDDRYFTIDELRAYRLSERYQSGGVAVATLKYHEHADLISDPRPAAKRLIECVRTLYYDDAGANAPTRPLTFGRHGPRGLKYEDYKLALTADLLTAVFGTKLGESINGSTVTQNLGQATSGYVSGAVLADRFAPLVTTGQYWAHSGVTEFAGADRFFLGERFTDAFGSVTDAPFNDADLYYVEFTRDAHANEARVIDFDARVLAPRALRDVNGNVTRARFDVLGMPVAIAMEAAGDSVGGITGTVLNPPAPLLERFFGLGFTPVVPYDESVPRRWLDAATMRYVYHFGETVQGGVTTYEAGPPAVCTVQRETHVAKLGGATTRIQASIAYCDGGGNVLVTKAQAEPAPGSTTLRWIASGKTILNNKGKPVKQYEPYFSGTQHHFDPREAADEIGVTPVLYYDAPGRLIRTEMADGALTRVEFSPWHATSFDANDTAFDADPARRSEWYRRRTDPAHPRFAEFDDARNRRAAEVTKNHANTPARTYLDSLGRDVVAIAHNRTPDTNGVWQDDYYVTFTQLDAEGKPLWTRDARGNLVMQYITPYKANDDPTDDMPFRTDAAGIRIYSAPGYDIAGGLLFQHSMDAGDRWMLLDAGGDPMHAWDANDDGPGTAVQQRAFYTECDDLHRPIKQWLQIDGGAAAVVEAFAYCDTDRPTTGAADLADARQRNLIGQAVKHWDPSGRATVERIDLSGQPAHVTRTLIAANASLNGIVNWNSSLTAPLDAETFEQITEYDALGRITLRYNWHRAAPDNRVAVYVPSYNERGLLLSETLEVGARKVANGHRPSARPPTKAIEEVRYNAKGQKELLKLANRTSTRYTYDAETFRLTRLDTRRDGTPPGIQDLRYVYDPSGNITDVNDIAQETVYTNNTVVRPQHQYVYDAIYRLIAAEGRENPAAASPPKTDEGRWPQGAFPTNTRPRNYTQRYSYDRVGNFVAIVHQPSAATGWTRRYSTKADSNRLDQTWYNNDRITAVTYHHDAHGNMRNVNRVQTPPPLDPDATWGLQLQWDWRDMIRSFDAIGGGTATYHYGIDKQRTRKRIERPGNVEEDRVYLDGYELYRRRTAAGVVEEIESHHLFAGEDRVLLVDDVVVSSKGTTAPRADALTVKAQTLFRYQYGNHLGSACLELDDQAEIISYEEYHPYGTNAYRLMEAAKEAPPKRYRYTGMERDEESGLSYHGARYYLPWLGRWQSADPGLAANGLNVWVYVSNRPIHLLDPDGESEKEAQERAKELLAKYGSRKTTGWENILPSPNPIRIENMARKGTAPYEKIMRAEDTGKLANVVANVSLGFAGGEVVGPLLSAAPKIVQYGAAALGAVGAFDAGVGATESVTGTKITGQSIQGWERFERGAYSFTALASLAYAGRETLGKLSQTVATAAKEVFTLYGSSFSRIRPTGAINLMPWSQGRGSLIPNAMKLKPSERAKLERLRRMIDDLAAAAIGMSEADKVAGTFGRKGTRAHAYLEEMINQLNDSLIAANSPFRVEAEQFFDAAGGLASRRGKGSLGVDIRIKFGSKVIENPDLKTGRGPSSSKLADIEKRAGGPSPSIGPYVDSYSPPR